jgi:protein-L-isoaspartate O-methyltransferase
MSAVPASSTVLTTSPYFVSSYERDRNQAAIESLRSAAYAQGFEPGCALGELTVQLARVCDRLLATDAAGSALQQARRRCAAFKNVDIRCVDLSAYQPAGPFDLIVLNEIGCFYRPAELIRIGVALADTLASGGELMAVHGLERHHALHGDAVHSLLGRHLPLEWADGFRHGGFRIDHWVRV